MSQNVLAVLAEVAEKVNGSNTAVKQRVVDAYVEKEVASRADLLDKSLSKLVEMDKALKKVKPDIETVDGEGKLSSSWSKKAWDERKKSEDKKAALEKAVEAALTGAKDEWNKLKDALQKAGSASDGKNANEQ
jgi:hypothetical protein